MVGRLRAVFAIFTAATTLAIDNGAQIYAVCAESFANFIRASAQAIQIAGYKKIQIVRSAKATACNNFICQRSNIHCEILLKLQSKSTKAATLLRKAAFDV
jgi:hypothetical protein